MVERGTPVGFGHIAKAREQILEIERAKAEEEGRIAKGAHVVMPVCFWELWFRFLGHFRVC